MIKRLILNELCLRGLAYGVEKRESLAGKCLPFVLRGTDFESSSTANLSWMNRFV